MTTIEEALAAVRKHSIRMHGFSTRLSVADLNEWRNSSSALDEVDFCRQWLRGAERRKTINKGRSSYGLKHTLESQTESPW